ncbi:Pyrrolidone-carboxylate peptidase [Acinetobacter baumannii]|nr:Pyrrolidone-carboxylate peptidase [Acinetobacter baumannii]
MQKVLITGFEPFGGERLNPSWEVVKQLNDMELVGTRIVARQLPCVFGDALEALNAAIDEVQPVMVLAIGQAGGRTDITIERVAINVDDARIPDNQGQQPVDEPIVAGGPAAYFSTLPIKAMVSSMREAGIPAAAHPGAPSMAASTVLFALELAVSIALQVEHDLKVVGGATH